MVNFYETIRDVLQFRKFQLDEMLFVQYTCPIVEEEFGIWTQRDYIIYVLSGRKVWKTIEGSITAEAGDIFYVKKGGSIVEQSFEEDFCMICFFLTDEFIKKTVNDLKGHLPLQTQYDRTPQLVAIHRTPVLNGYFQAMLRFFEGTDQPVKSLLELKFRELLISIISSSENAKLASYFVHLSEEGQLSIPHFMERNYIYNLSLEEMAKLCNRSLSTFKREFKKHYNTSPGKWLLSKRLERAAVLLHSESANITQVAFECGFEDSSHFSRAFKRKFGQSPLHYKNDLLSSDT